jgi:hypothetical protein
VVAVAVLAILLYQLPAVNTRLGWRVDFALAYLRGIVNPVGEVPTALPPPEVITISRLQPSPTPTQGPTATLTPGPTPTPAPTPTPIPGAVSLTPPRWEKQAANNCGPATLALYLRYYGWEGDQNDISDMLKPHSEDRNVNVEELHYYAQNRAGWLNSHVPGGRRPGDDQEAACRRHPGDDRGELPASRLDTGPTTTSGQPTITWSPATTTPPRRSPPRIHISVPTR